MSNVSSSTSSKQTCTVQSSNVSLCLRVSVRVAIVAVIAALALSFIRPVGDMPLLSAIHATKQPETMLDKLKDRYHRFFQTEDEWASMTQEKEKFLRKYSPNGEYGYSGEIEEIIANELPRMKDQVMAMHTICPSHSVLFNRCIWTTLEAVFFNNHN